VNKLSAQLIFFFQTQVLQKKFEFSATKYTQNHYLSHLSSENCEINSIKFDLPRAFQQQQKCPQIPKGTFQFLQNFQPQILIYFSMKKSSIFKNFAPQVYTMKPSPCTPPHRELSKKTKNAI
jgi:hypothetical protein